MWFLIALAVWVCEDNSKIDLVAVNDRAAVWSWIVHLVLVPSYQAYQSCVWLNIKFEENMRTLFKAFPDGKILSCNSLVYKSKLSFKEIKINLNFAFSVFVVSIVKLKPDIQV